MCPFGLRAVFLLLSISLSLTQGIYKEFEIQDNSPAGKCFERTVENSNMPLDCQSDPTKHTYILRSPVRGENQYFKVIKASSVLCMAKSIDRDTLCEETRDSSRLCCDQADTCVIPLSVAVIDPANSMPCPVKINVKITDLNDNTPEFPHSIQYLNISESTNPGTPIRLIPAKDDDSRRYSVKHYRAEFEQGNPGFRLLQNEFVGGIGDLSLDFSQELDRERQETYSFILKAIDGGQPPRTGTTTVSIRVTDVNDNGPIFEKEIYTLRVKEGVISSHKEVLQVLATDKDIGLNAVVRYSFGPNKFKVFDAATYFRLDSQTGKLFLIKALDYERNPHPNFTVIARDNAGHYSTATATVKIQVENINDEKPEIKVEYLTSSNYKEIKENQKGNSFIAYIHVLDKDAGHFGQVTCKLLSYDNFYTISKTNTNHEPGVVTYAVRSQGPLDREKGDRQDIKVKCVDTGKPQNVAEANIYVRILDENDNTPEISISGPARVKENEKPGTVVAIVEAKDDDEGQNGNVTFSIDKSVHSTKQYLRINALNGKITTIQEIDRERDVRDILPVIVEARDHGTKPRTATFTFTVTIVDVNDNAPTFFNNPLTYSIAENKPATTLGEIEIQDRDKNPQITLKITPKKETNLPFKIHARPGNKFFLNTTKPLDRELKERYDFQIVATDGSDASAHRVSVDVIVMVENENDNAPQIIYPASDNSTVRVSYLERKDHPIVKINADDKDVGRTEGHFFFNLIDDKGSKSKKGSIVMIDTTAGEIKVRREMSRDDIGPHWIKVVVKDHGSPTKTASVRIKILVDDSEPNSPPRLPPGYTGSIWTDDTTLVFILVIIMVLLLAIVTLFIYIRHSRNYFKFLPDLLLLCDKRPSNNNRKDNKKSQIRYSEASTALNENDHEMHGVVDLFNSQICGTISTGELVKLDKQEADRRAQLYLNHYSTSSRGSNRTLPYKNVNYEIIENGAQVPAPRYHDIEAAHTLKRLNSEARGSYDALLSPHRQRTIPVYSGESGRLEHYYQTLANAYEEGKVRPNQSYANSKEAESVNRHGHQWSNISENITGPTEMSSIYNQGNDQVTLNRKVPYYKSDPMLNWDKPPHMDNSIDPPQKLSRPDMPSDKYENFAMPSKMIKSHSKHGLKSTNDRYAHNQLVYDCDHENDAYAVSFPKMQASFV